MVLASQYFVENTTLASCQFEKCEAIIVSYGICFNLDAWDTESIRFSRCDSLTDDLILPRNSCWQLSVIKGV